MAMKKIFTIGKVLLSILVIALTSFVVMSKVTQNNLSTWAYTTDMLNPLVRTHAVYGKVPIKSTNSWQDQATKKTDYGYKINTYDDKGKQRTLEITSYGGPLSASHNAYLKITAKGQYVNRYEAISQENVPSPAINKLNKR